MKKLPNLVKKNRKLSLLFYPHAFEYFDFSDYDYVISISSFLSKSILTKPYTKHIEILLTPPRYIWGMSDVYLTGVLKYFSSFYLNYLRKWDYIAAQRSDKIISISNTIKNRCEKYYNRESFVLYPPFDYEYWERLKNSITVSKSVEKLIEEVGSFYLVVSRLEPYKKVDLAVETFVKNQDKKLIIVGKGTEEYRLKNIATDNIYFLSYVSDSDLAYLYSKAEALISPQEEDFGYVSLEAQINGCPVIAYGKGGLTETVEEGLSGMFFAEQKKESLSSALERFESVSYNKAAIISSIMGRNNLFAKQSFKNKFLALLQD
jgi:glycosyltransferase involved in cell wall biosynthesis